MFGLKYIFSEKTNAFLGGAVFTLDNMVPSTPAPSYAEKEKPAPDKPMPGRHPTSNMGVTVLLPSCDFGRLKVAVNVACCSNVNIVTSRCYQYS